MSRIVSLRKYILSKVLKDGGKKALQVLEGRVFGTNKQKGWRSGECLVCSTNNGYKANAAREECVRVNREHLSKRDQEVNERQVMQSL